MKDIILRELRYSPGYSDMRGARHEEVLKKDENGTWIIVCSDRDYYNAPVIVTTYEVKTDKVLDFEAFLKKKDILSLQNRKQSKDFICDYHPWEFRLIFDDISLEKSKYEYYSFDQYKSFSYKDMSLIKKLRENFKALRGAKISEITKDIW